MLWCTCACVVLCTSMLCCIVWKRDVPESCGVPVATCKNWIQAAMLNGDEVNI